MNNKAYEERLNEEKFRKAKAEADRAEEEVNTEKSKQEKMKAEAGEKKWSNKTKIFTLIIGIAGTLGGMVLKKRLEK
jgi:VIT1/CCC1 family predicted Fe2+/Mn2+ transporter